MQSVYEAAGGSTGLLRLAEAWHARVMDDRIVSHAFSHGFHPQHSERLAAYWAEALGGPANYSGSHGDETSVVRMHSGNGQHAEMDRRAIACFDQAMQDVGLDAAGPLRRVLHDYFAWATTTTMSQYHQSADEVPEGLSIPRWSWDGLISDQMSLADVKNRLSDLLDQLEREHGRVVITKHGHPAAVVISVADLESLEETLDIMDSKDLLADIRAGLGEIAATGAQVLSKDEALRSIPGR